jgi:hypothetical protein
LVVIYFTCIILFSIKYPYINISALTVWLVMPFPTYFTQMKQNNIKIQTIRFIVT